MPGSLQRFCVASCARLARDVLPSFLSAHYHRPGRLGTTSSFSPALSLGFLAVAWTEEKVVLKSTESPITSPRDICATTASVRPDGDAKPREQRLDVVEPPTERNQHRTRQRSGRRSTAWKAQLAAPAACDSYQIALDITRCAVARPTTFGRSRPELPVPLALDSVHLGRPPNPATSATPTLCSHDFPYDRHTWFRPFAVTFDPLASPTAAAAPRPSGLR